MIFGAPASRGRVDERGRGSKIIDLQRIPPNSQNAAFRAFILLNRATYRVFPGFQRKNAIHSSIFIDLTSQQLEKLYKSFRKPLTSNRFPCKQWGKLYKSFRNHENPFKKRWKSAFSYDFSMFVVFFFVFFQCFLCVFFVVLTWFVYAFFVF